MTKQAVFAMRVSQSNLAGVEIDTPGHLEEMLRVFAFKRGRDVGEFRVLAR